MDKRRTYAMFTIVTLIAALGGMTQTVMNSMLGGVEATFGTPESVSQWLTTVYMLVIGITVPLVTHLSRRFSLRTLIFIAIAFMFAGGVVAALSPHFAVLFVARILQAISAGITLPLLQAIAMTHFPPGKNATAMGIAGMALGFAPNIGPLIGGVLVDTLGWRSYFWMIAGVMVAFAAATLALVQRREHEAKAAHLDFISAMLSTLGFGGLLMSFSSMAYRPLDDAAIWIELLVGVVSLALFVRRQSHIKHPLIHLTIFRSRTLVTCFVTQCMLYASFMGITLILPLFILNIAHMTPMYAGLVFLPTTILAIAFNPISGMLSDKIGPRPVTIGASVFLFVGALSMAFIDESTPFWLITAFQVIRGIGVSSIIGPLNSWGLHKLPMENMIDGSALLNATRQACASFGTALMMILVSVIGGVLGFHLAFGLSALFAAGMLVGAVFFVRDLKS